MCDIKVLRSVFAVLIYNFFFFGATAQIGPRLPRC